MIDSVRIARRFCQIYVSLQNFVQTVSSLKWLRPLNDLRVHSIDPPLIYRVANGVGDHELRALLVAVVVVFAVQFRFCASWCWLLFFSIAWIKTVFSPLYLCRSSSMELFASFHWIFFLFLVVSSFEHTIVSTSIQLTADQCNCAILCLSMYVAVGSAVFSV